MFSVTSSSSTLRPGEDESLSCFTTIAQGCFLAAPDNLTQSLPIGTVADWGRSESKAIDDFHIELEKASEVILASGTNNRKTSRNTGEQSILTTTFSPASPGPGTEHHKYDICPESRQSLLLKQHEVKNSDNRPFRCPVCQQAFAKKHHFDEHTQLVHQNNFPFQCDQCNKKYKRSSELTRHKKSHDNKRPFRCDTCGKTFTARCGLTQHQTAHSNDFLFRCDTCGKTFKFQSSYSDHKRVHGDECPFQCGKCGKYFKKEYYFMRHLDTHQDVKQKTNITHSETILANPGNASATNQSPAMNNQTSTNDIHVNKSQDQKEYEVMISLLNELQESIPACHVESGITRVL